MGAAAVAGAGRIPPPDAAGRAPARSPPLRTLPLAPPWLVGLRPSPAPDRDRLARGLAQPGELARRGRSETSGQGRRRPSGRRLRPVEPGSARWTVRTGAGADDDRRARGREATGAVPSLPSPVRPWGRDGV